LDTKAILNYLIANGHTTKEEFDKKVADFKYQNENPTFDYSGLSLKEAKEQKVQELTHNCKQDIIYGFVASNGNAYRLTVEDQLNMQGQKNDLDDDPNITSVGWMTKDDVSITHTRDEWLTMYKEAFQHKNDTIWKNKSLRDQVLAETTDTVEKVKNIEW